MREDQVTRVWYTVLTSYSASLVDRQSAVFEEYVGPDPSTRSLVCDSCGSVRPIALSEVSYEAIKVSE
jgi:hypothetical protein